MKGCSFKQLDLSQVPDAHFAFSEEKKNRSEPENKEKHLRDLIKQNEEFGEFLRDFPSEATKKWISGRQKDSFGLAEVLYECLSSFVQYNKEIGETAHRKLKEVLANGRGSFKRSFERPLFCSNDSEMICKPANVHSTEVSEKDFASQANSQDKRYNGGSTNDTDTEGNNIPVNKRNIHSNSDRPYKEMMIKSKIYNHAEGNNISDNKRNIPSNFDRPYKEMMLKSEIYNYAIENYKSNELNEDAIFNHCLAGLRKKEVQDAVPILENSLKSSKNSKLYFLLCLAYFQQERFYEAISILERLFDINLMFLEDPLVLPLLLTAEREFEEALHFLQLLFIVDDLDDWPLKSWAYLYWGEILSRRNQAEKAKVILQACDQTKSLGTNALIVMRQWITQKHLPFFLYSNDLNDPELASEIINENKLKELVIKLFTAWRINYQMTTCQISLPTINLINSEKSLNPKSEKKELYLTQPKRTYQKRSEFWNIRSNHAIQKAINGEKKMRDYNGANRYRKLFSFLNRFFDSNFHDPSNPQMHKEVIDFHDQLIRSHLRENESSLEWLTSLLDPCTFSLLYQKYYNYRANLFHKICRYMISFSGIQRCQSVSEFKSILNEKDIETLKAAKIFIKLGLKVVPTQSDAYLFKEEIKQEHSPYLIWLLKSKRMSVEERLHLLSFKGRTMFFATLDELDFILKQNNYAVPGFESILNEFVEPESQNEKMGKCEEFKLSTTLDESFVKNDDSISRANDSLNTKREYSSLAQGFDNDIDCDNSGLYKKVKIEH